MYVHFYSLGKIVIAHKKTERTCILQQAGHFTRFCQHRTPKCILYFSLNCRTLCMLSRSLSTHATHKNINIPNGKILEKTNLPYTSGPNGEFPTQTTKLKSANPTEKDKTFSPNSILIFSICCCVTNKVVRPTLRVHRFSPLNWIKYSLASFAPTRYRSHAFGKPEGVNKRQFQLIAADSFLAVMFVVETSHEVLFD